MPTPDELPFVKLDLTLPLAEVARIKLSSALTQNIFATQNYLFAATLDGRIHTIASKDFTVVGKKKLRNRSAGTLAIADEALLIAVRYARTHSDLL